MIGLLYKEEYTCKPPMRIVSREFANSKKNTPTKSKKNTENKQNKKSPKIGGFKPCNKKEATKPFNNKEKRKEKRQPKKSILDKLVKASEWKPNTHITKLKGELGKFIGGYEHNQFAIVLRGEKGAGKTRLMSQILNLFCSEGKKGLFLTLEVAQDSELFGEYLSYISKKNRKRLDISETTKLEDLREFCKIYDVIAIDSWGKLQGVKQEDFFALMKEFPHVLFVCIFQSTTAGSVRGGIMTEYDGSSVIQVADGGNAEFEKNRYNSEKLVYNVFKKQLIKTDEN